MVVALTFGAIFVVELPDKTFIATLVLATRFRPVLVWLGVGLAFTVQTGVAVALGHAASFLPTAAVRTLALLMFLAGAVILFRQGRSHHVESGEAYAERAGDASGLKAVGASSATTSPGSRGPSTRSPATGWAHDASWRCVNDGPDEVPLDDIERYLLGARPTPTQIEVAQAGVPLVVAEELWSQLGFPAYRPTRTSPSPRATSERCR